jgi:Chromo (CHRromatin Organisation MOdifier) domain
MASTETHGDEASSQRDEPMRDKDAEDEHSEVEKSEEEDESEEYYVVEKILTEHKSENGDLYYKVRWAGYGPEDDTIEPSSNLSHCVDILRNWEERKQQMGRDDICISTDGSQQKGADRTFV